MPDPDVLRSRLLADRAAALTRIAELSADHAGVLAASLDDNADDEHDPEGATIAFEREQLTSLRSRAAVQLEEIDAALARLADGRYGQCEACGGQITAARLDARPVARRCVSCARC